MRIILFGSSRFSCTVLGHLLGSAHELVGLVTQPDTPSGRKMLDTPTPVCLDVSALDIPIFKPSKLINNRELKAELKALNPDAIIVVSYGKIIPKSLLKLTDWPLNVHPSDLPRLRGASPIRSAMLLGLEKTACCIMKMTPRLDDGDVLSREFHDIRLDCDHDQLELDLGLLGGRMAVEALDAIGKGQVELTPQDDAEATYCSTYERIDTQIDWQRPATEIVNFVRAWDPDLGSFTKLDDGRRLKIWKVTEQSAPECEGTIADGTPGQVVAATKKGLWVATGNGTIRILELQPDNKNRMPLGSYLAGNKVNVGQFFVPCDAEARCYEQ